MLGQESYQDDVRALAATLIDNGSRTLSAWSNELLQTVALINAEAAEKLHLDQRLWVVNEVGVLHLVHLITFTLPLAVKLILVHISDDILLDPIDGVKRTHKHGIHRHHFPLNIFNIVSSKLDLQRHTLIEVDGPLLISEDVWATISSLLEPVNDALAHQVGHVGHVGVIECFRVVDTNLLVSRFHQK